MIQRRATVGIDPPNASAVDDNPSKPTRRRRTKQKGRRKGGWFKGVGRVLKDEDALVTMIQLVSVIIIFGCLVTLFLHFLGTEQTIGDDDDGSSGSKLNSLLGKLGKNMQPKLHQDHENSEHYKRDDGKEFDALPPSSIYTVPGSMPHIGDKSDGYAALRMEYDAMDLPKVEQRYKFETMPMEENKENSPAPYDIHNCPEEPPEFYPYSWNLLQLLDHWSPDDVEVPEDNTIFQGLCVFDFETDYDKAMNYRQKEVPYIVTNDPAVQETAKRWMAPGYMDRLMGLGDTLHRTEYSETSHFMYWNAGSQVKRQQHMSKQQAHKPNAFLGDGHPDGRGVDKDLAHWQQPTKMMRMPYNEWIQHANSTEGQHVGSRDAHYYYRLIGCGEESPEGKCDKGSSEYLFDELTFFQPKENLYMVDPKQQHGIHCRFGMRGVIAENHFDMSRNSIALMGGERRYILSHPDQCPLMSLLPKGHPSARHSAVDWCDPDLETYPEFAQAESNEVVLQAGDVLYLPTNWFHFIVSLNVNFQCNTRSGISQDYQRPIHKCGF